MLQQLQTAALSFLALFFDFEKVVRTVVIVLLHFRLLCILVIDVFLQLLYFDLTVLFRIQQGSKLGYLRVDQEIFFRQCFDDVVFGFDFVVEKLIFVDCRGVLLGQLLELINRRRILLADLDQCIVDLLADLPTRCLERVQLFLHFQVVTLSRLDCFDLSSFCVE